MSQKLVEERDLPITSVHPHPDNPRSRMGDLDTLAAQIKAFGGLMEPITVWPHPTLEGDYQIRSGHRRHQASLKAGMTQIRCRVIERPQNARRALLEEALTTGTNHQTLEVTERAQAIQGLLDEGASESWISKTYQIEKQNVRPTARLASSPKLAELAATGKVDLLAMKVIQDAEDEIGNENLLEDVLEEVARSWRTTVDSAEVTRVIERKKAAAQAQVTREELAAKGAVEIGAQDRYSGKWSKTKTALSVEEHIEAGHQFDVGAPPAVEWWMKTKATKPALTPEQKAEKEKVRHLDSVLAISQRGRRAFVIGKAQDKKGITERDARGLMVSMIFDAGLRGYASDPGEALGEVLSIPYPEPPEGASKYDREFRDGQVAKWEDRARKALQQLSLPQLALLLAWMPVVEADAKLVKTNWYARDSGDKESRWSPLALWYQQLIDFVGYVPTEDEIAAIRWGEKGACRKDNGVRLNTVTCRQCRQEVVADSKWKGVCDECAPAMDGIEVD